MKRLFSLMLCITSVLYSSAQNYQWTWLDGDNYVPEYPVFGPKGMMGSTYNPGNRSASLRWKDNGLSTKTYKMISGSTIRSER